MFGKAKFKFDKSIIYFFICMHFDRRIKKFFTGDGGKQNYTQGMEENRIIHRGMTNFRRGVPYGKNSRGEPIYRGCYTGV